MDVWWDLDIGHTDKKTEGDLKEPRHRDIDSAPGTDNH